MTRQEAYRLFGLLEDQPITPDLIKNRYRILTKTYHPDNPRTGNADMMARINVAFDAIRKNQYDSQTNQEDMKTANQNSHEEYNWNKDFDVEDFTVDFDPFEFTGDDFAYHYYSREEQTDQNHERKEGAWQERAYEDEASNEAEYEEEEVYESEWEDALDDANQSARRNPFVLFLRMIGRLCQFFIILACIASFIGIFISLYLFGLNQRGFFMAVIAAVMCGLFVLMFRFFNELAS